MRACKFAPVSPNLGHQYPIIQPEVYPDMPTIIVYSRRYCGYCTAAKSLLQSQGYTYQEINLDESPQLALEVMARTGMRTVPIITVGEHTVGGFRELYSAINGGDFAELLESEHPET